MLIIPAIDLKDGRCVRLTQGRKRDVKVYDGDPVEIAKEFEKAGAQMLHVVDLDGAFADSNSPNRETVKSIIRALKIPMQTGGGLRRVSDVEDLIESGAERVIIGTLAAESPEILEKLVKIFGAARICVGIDARDGIVLTRGWEREGKLSALELARRVGVLGIERIVYTDVSRDGMLGGVNLEQTCEVARESGLRVTASGGVSSLADLAGLKTIEACGVDSVIVGKALYEGRFTLEEALKAA